jgi:recombination protein RecA
VIGGSVAKKKPKPIVDTSIDYATRLDALKKKHGDAVFLKTSDPERIPTRFLRLNTALGGGLPKGRVIELYGKEGSYKSTMCLMLMADVAKHTGKRVVYLDHEHAFTGAYADALGVTEIIPGDYDDWVLQPRFFEMGADAALDLVGSGEVALVVLDSIAHLQTLAEMQTDVAKDLVGIKARKISQFLYKATPLFDETGAILCCINQLREKVGVMFGNPETTPGGRALKHTATIRMRMGVKQVENHPELKDVVVKLIKNKITGQYPEIIYRASVDCGFDLSGELLDACIDADIVKVVPKTGYVFPGEHTFKLKAKAKEAAEEAREPLLKRLAAMYSSEE